MTYFDFNFTVQRYEKVFELMKKSCWERVWEHIKNAKICECNQQKIIIFCWLYPQNLVYLHLKKIYILCIYIG